MAVLSSFQRKFFIVQPINNYLMRQHHTKHKYKNVRHSPCQYEAYNLTISQELLQG